MQPKVLCFLIKFILASFIKHLTLYFLIIFYFQAFSIDCPFLESLVNLLCCVYLPTPQLL